MMNRSRIHRLLYSNAALLARAFEVTLSGPCGNQLKNSSGETINVLHSDDDDRMSSIVLEKDKRIVLYDGGHGLIGLFAAKIQDEIIGWLDQQFGPVNVGP